MKPAQLRRLASATWAVLVLPTVFGVLVPIGIVLIDSWRGKGLSIGLVFFVLGTGVVAWCVRDFFVIGQGTLAPWDPPKKLLTSGLYRFVRNPMYVGVILVVVGWSIYFGSPVVGLYSGVMAIVFHLRVMIYEEPTLEKEFPQDWPQYSRHVGRWLPHRIMRS